MGQKRRRIALSCVDCRRRKVKCDRNFPICIRCQKGGYGDKCLYVSHTGPGEGSLAGLPTPEDERRHSRASTEHSWDQDASQIENQAHNNETGTKRTFAQVATPSVPLVRPAPQSNLAGNLPLTDRRIGQLYNKLIELETVVYSAGGKPVSQEMNAGLLNPMGPGAQGSRNPYADTFDMGDQEKVLLRGKSFKTQYFGPSHTLAILLQFEDLSKFVREILLAIPSLANAKHSISKLREKEKKAARAPYDLSIESLVAQVPEKSYADRLLYHYLDTIETTYRVLHVPTFLKEYESYWQAPKDAKPEFAIQLLIAMSMTVCITPGGEEGFVGRSSAKRELATHWINICNYWLESQSKKHVALINYQLLLQIWMSKLLNCVKVKRFWTESGGLVRHFMAAGLHREPNLLCGKINTFDCEMRRRLWYTVLELDLQATIDRGMTPTIGSLDWDTLPPLNIDDESFDEDTEKMPEPKARGSFTRTSFLSWAAESLAVRIEVLQNINSIRNALDHDTIMLHDHKIRHIFDNIPLEGWKEAATQDQPQSTLDTPRPTGNTPACHFDHASTLASARVPQTAGTPTSASTATSSLLPLTLAQAILYEFLTILHQPFPTQHDFKSAHFHSRVARRYACISTILLYNPTLSIQDTTQQPTIPQQYHLSKTQSRFFAFFRDDYGRACLSLAQSFVVSVTASGHGNWLLHVGNDGHLISMIEAAVNMLEDRVLNLGQGFHGYWITSSALSFVHSKQSPNVPRQTFARAAADRVVKLHGAVMDGQLPRAKRLMVPVEVDYSGHGIREPNPAANGSQPVQSPAQQMEAVTSVKGVLDLQATATPQAVSNAINNVYGVPAESANIGGGAMMEFDGSGGAMLSGNGMNGANSGANTGTMGTGGDQFMGSELYEDVMFGLENMDWNQLMSADPTAFMMGTWDYPS